MELDYVLIMRFFIIFYLELDFIKKGGEIISRIGGGDRVFLRGFFYIM